MPVSTSTVRPAVRIKRQFSAIGSRLRSPGGPISGSQTVRGTMPITTPASW